MFKKFILASMIATGACGLAQAEATKVMDVADWEVYRDADMGNGCYMAKLFWDESLMMLGFDLAEDKAFISVFSEDLGQVDDGEIYPVNLALNGESYEADAVGVKGDEGKDGVIVFIETEDFLLDLANGETFTLSQGDTDLMSILLEDTKPAVVATLDCVQGA